jgi:fatty-acyl-CoA synthase/benzoate-CoA ligase/fatty acid CoA ligase FadD22
VSADLSSLLLDRALERGVADRPALRWEGREWSYADLARRTGAAAGWLSERGIRRGDVLLLLMADRPEWVALFLGAARIGAVSALASPWLPPDRVDDAVRRLAPAAVMMEGPGSARGARTLSAASARAALEDGPDDPGPAQVRPADPAYLLLTSGSTGAAKWALHRAGDIRACLATYGRRVLRLRPGDVTWSVAALPTSYGLGNSCYFPLGAGACAALAGADRSPARCAAACREDGVTVLFGVPTSWARLARHVEEGRVDPEALAGVRLAVSAGEALPADLWRRVRRATGLRLVNGLGSSEATNLYLSDHVGRPRPGTLGWPVPGYELRLRPLEDGDARAGELLVRGPTVMAGYLGAAETGEPFEDGWLRTGDVVRREEDGSYTYLRRLGDRFKAAALWVEAERVRRELERDPDVLAAVALPVRDAAGLVRVGAAVVPALRAGPDLGERLLATAAERLAPHEVPRALIVLPRMPTTASGKLDRGELARLLTRELDASVGAGRAAG